MESKELSLEGFTVTITKEEHPVFKPWELKVMNYLWAAKKPVSSWLVWDMLQGSDMKARGRDRPVSRASAINFLERLTDAGILKNTPKSGKGGYHGLYTITVTPTQLYDQLAHAVNEALSESKEAK